MDKRLAAVEQAERIPGTADEGFRAIKIIGGDTEPAEDKALENVIYAASRTPIQMSIEMRYANGLADCLAGNPGLEKTRE